jgi:hypothetical protein
VRFPYLNDFGLLRQLYLFAVLRGVETMQTDAQAFPPPAGTVGDKIMGLMSAGNSCNCSAAFDLRIV